MYEYIVRPSINLCGYEYQYQCCCGSGLSRILIFAHPGSWIPDTGYRSPDPGYKNSNKREG
jgi:hypothetical protein